MNPKENMNINVNIDQFEVLAPVVSSNLLSIVYQKLTLKGIKTPTKKEYDHLLKETIAEWSLLTVTISDLGKNPSEGFS